MINYYSESSLTIYLRKQKSFINLVNSIQKAINSKDYRKHGYTLNSYVKKNWNISKAQAYRYLLSAKVLDQLKEFKILPNYERLCRTISVLTKTQEQVKFLWKTVLRKVENRLGEINTSLISNVWKELYQDKKYHSICHYEDNTMKKKDLAEITYSENKEIINADSNSKKTNNSPTYPLISSPISIESNIQINDNISQSSNFPSPTFTESNNSQVNEEASSNSSNTPLSIVGR